MDEVKGKKQYLFIKFLASVFIFGLLFYGGAKLKEIFWDNQKSAPEAPKVQQSEYDDPGLAIMRGAWSIAIIILIVLGAIYPVIKGNKKIQN